MKICIISSYPPEKEGVGKFTKRLVDNLKNDDLDIYVLTFDYRAAYGDNKKIYQILGPSPRNIIRTYRKLVSLSPHIIHVQYAISLYRLFGIMLWIILLRYKKRHKVRIITTFHEVKREISLLKSLGIKYYSFMSRITDIALVHTSEARDILIDMIGMAQDRVLKIPLGLYSGNSIKSVYGKSLGCINNIDLRGKKVVLFFGYIHADKGIDDLINAVDLLYREAPALRTGSSVLIAGEIRPRRSVFKVFEYIDLLYKKRLKKMVRGLGLENNIKFLGYIEDREVYPLLNRAAVIVLPYKKVEQSGVLNLALNLDKPVISTNIGGFKEILNGSGLVVEPADPRLLKDKLKQVLTGSLDPGINKTYREIRRNNSLGRIVDIHMMVYKNII